MMQIAKCFENGFIYTITDTLDAESIDFIPHPKFKGVSLKHLVTGQSTGNQISCHLVKVEPFCILDTHAHENNLEIHEIISGEGTCIIGDRHANYTPGAVGIIPAKIVHRVEAGPNGLYILAKFTPALL